MKIHITLRSKIFFAMVCLNIVTIVLISLFFYHTSRTFLEERYSESLVMHDKTISKNMDEAFQKIYYAANRLSFSHEFQELCTDHMALEDKTLTKFLFRYKNENERIDSIYVFFPKTGRIYTDREWSAVHELNQEQCVGLQELIERYQCQSALEPLMAADVLAASHKRILTYLAPVQISDQGIVWIFVNMDERNFYYTYLDNLTHDNKVTMSVYLLDDKQQVVSEGRNSVDFSTSELSEILSVLREQKIKNGSFTHRKFLVIYAMAPFSNYYTLLLVDTKTLLRELFLLQIGVLFLSALVLLISFIPAYYMAKRVNQPLADLEHAMTKVGYGEFDTQVGVYADDEISRLSKGFNSMVQHIRQLIDEIIQEKTLKKEAEINSLQYQITPHFIYNTLNSIRFAAVMQGAKNIGKLLEMFVDLLQVSSNKKGSFLRLEDEIKTLQNYVGLQQFRHMDSFAVQYDIAEELKNFVVPRLILQPLVENSILHGPSGQKKFCKIYIRAILREKDLILMVEDDGQGMAREKIYRIQETREVSPEHYNHIGIKNIQERLQLYYGDRGRLDYESDGKTYTRAIITLPATRNLAAYQL